MENGYDVKKNDAGKVDVNVMMDSIAMGIKTYVTIGWLASGYVFGYYLIALIICAIFDIPLPWDNFGDAFFWVLFYIPFLIPVCSVGLFFILGITDMILGLFFRGGNLYLADIIDKLNSPKKPLYLDDVIAKIQSGKSSVQSSNTASTHLKG